VLAASSPPNVPSPVRITACTGDEHGRAVEAINQKRPQRLPCLCTLTTEHTPHIVRASAQLTGHAIAICASAWWSCGMRWP
jgi:hypothetical protein